MRLNLILVAGFLIIALVPIIAVSYLNLNTSSEIVVDKTMGSLLDDSKLHGKEMSILLDSFKEKVMFLSKVPPIQGIIRAKYNQGIDPTDDSTYDQWRDRLVILFEETMRSDEIGSYMQLRYIDEQGNELVRIDSDFGGENIRKVPEKGLQNKKDRYYFIETMALDKGELYVSDLDLNREGSPSKIEIPHKPVIRYATPIFDDMGNKRGMVIANIFADSFLQTFHSISEKENIHDPGEEEFLLDKEGFYFLNPDKNKEWGSSRDLDTGKNIKNDFPENMIAPILSGENGITHMSQHNHIMSHSIVYPDKENKEEFWIVLEIIPQNIILQPILDLRKTVVLVGVIFTILIVILTLLFSRGISKPIDELSDTVDEISKGNFKTEIKEKSKINEINKLAKSLSRVMKTMKLAVLEKGTELDKTKEDKTKNEK